VKAKTDFFSEAITPVFSVTWSFRNNFNMRIWCSTNISYYWKQLSSILFVWKL